MDLTHRFTVPAPIEEAWAAFNDLERIAPCFPGAALTSYDGEEFAGLVKVKLGPISLQYTGTGKFVERDEGAYRAVIEAKGKDKRGNGTAAASVTARLVSGAGGATDVQVVTALNITGKPAQFGRGVMQDVSDKLLGQFAACLETKLGTGETLQTEAPREARAKAPEDRDLEPQVSATQIPPQVSATELPPDSDAAELPPQVVAAPEPKARTAVAPHSPAPDAGGEAALNLGTTVLPILVRRYAPYAVGAVVGLVLAWRLVRRLR